MSNHVMVFDSGIGGLSICQEIINASNMIKLTYLSDNAAFPYGEKTAQEVIQRACDVVYRAYIRFRPDIIVIACNTASTVVLPTLRAQLSIPVVGVVPVIKTAASISQTKTFGLLATPGTVSRVYTAQLITEHAKNCNVISVGSSKLVREVEQYLYGKSLDLQLLKKIILEFEQQDTDKLIDTIILGCTHFPLIKKELTLLRPHWQWIDSGNAISSRVTSLLKKMGGSFPNNEEHDVNNHQHDIWFTLKDKYNTKVSTVLKGVRFSPAQYFHL